MLTVLKSRKISRLGSQIGWLLGHFSGVLRGVCVKRTLKLSFGSNKIQKNVLNSFQLAWGSARRRGTVCLHVSRHANNSGREEKRNRKSFTCTLRIATVWTHVRRAAPSDLKAYLHFNSRRRVTLQTRCQFDVFMQAGRGRSSRINTESTRRRTTPKAQAIKSAC